MSLGPEGERSQQIPSDRVAFYGTGNLCHTKMPGGEGRVQRPHDYITMKQFPTQRKVESGSLSQNNGGGEFNLLQTLL
jgi:hypothetical protein